MSTCHSTKTHRPHRKRFFQWVPTDDDQLALTEKRMLKRIEGSYEQHEIEGLNTICYRNSEHKKTLVLLHGFAGGVGNWVPNWNELTSYCNVYAVDLPGFGRSCRPKNVSFKTDNDAITFMTDTLYRWFNAVGFDKPVDLCGHSFGGYISAMFALRHPDLVDHLVLADPWGVQPKHDRELPFKYRVLLRLFYWGNPLSVLRGAGPWGPGLLPKVRSDFADRWAPYVDDVNTFYDYTFHCNAHGRPVGEQAFQACCTGTAFAKQPLLEALPGKLSPKIKFSAIYGRHTWMDRTAGASLVDAINARRGRRATFGLVDDAGHQIMSDNAEGFTTELLTALEHLTAL